MLVIKNDLFFWYLLNVYHFKMYPKGTSFVQRKSDKICIKYSRSFFLLNYMKPAIISKHKWEFSDFCNNKNHKKFNDIGVHISSVSRRRHERVGGVETTFHHRFQNISTINQIALQNPNLLGSQAFVSKYFWFHDMSPSIPTPEGRFFRL